MADLLFLAHRIPYPPDRGDKIRSWHMLRHLGSLGRVHLACFADDAQDAAALPALRAAMGARLGEAHVELRGGNRLAAALALAQGAPLSLALFRSSNMRSFVDRLLASHDVATIFAFSSQMAQFVPDPPAEGRRFVMDFVDMDSAKFADYGAQHRGPLAWLYRREARTLLEHERATAARADTSLFVSEAEAALFSARAGAGPRDIRAVGNGVDLGYYDPAGDFPRLEPAVRGAGPLIVFIGQMDYRPNIEAVTSFATAVMPLIRRKLANARFAIVGRKPDAAVRRLDGRHGTFVTGAVTDVRRWLAAADVVVAPLGIARGIQNKVLEAMAMGRPIIASPAAFLGIDAEPGRDLLVAEDAKAQASAAVELLRDRARAEALGAAARRRIEQGYQWERMLAPLDRIVMPPTQAAA
ncbi:MAG: family PEP-CTERM/XrtA system glycosyltransferase [Alphaproteobacteria bacterium]|nr:family PEP-CTERM/XrtA system glycosyltransferase [Alphaproteobacteria bacterium]